MRAQPSLGMQQALTEQTETAPSLLPLLPSVQHTHALTPQVAAKHSCMGFTLIELLASIAILAVLVTILGTIFTESDRAWKLGAARAEMNNEARAAVTAIANDLQYAIAYASTNNADTNLNYNLTFIMRPEIESPLFRPRPGIHSSAQWPVRSYGFTNSEICFVMLKGKSEFLHDRRSTLSVYYWVREMTKDDNLGGTPLGRYELMRTMIRTDGTNGPYGNTNWFTTTQSSPGHRHTAANFGTIAENIAGVAFYAPTGNGMTKYYYSVAHSNRLPEYVDVVVDALSDDDARRAADLTQRFGNNHPEVTRFVERNLRRYTQRVYFQNRAGYRNRW